MNVLSISLDKNLLDRQSDVSQRHLFYSSCVDQYWVIVFTGWTKNIGWQEDKLRIIPLNRLNIFKVLKVLNPSLITVQDPFLTGLCGLIIKWFFGIPLNVQIHSEFFNTVFFRREKLLNFLLYYLGLFVISQADTVRGRNKKITKDLIKRFPRLIGKIGYVPVRLNEVFFSPIQKENFDRNLVISGPRLDKQKNLPLLLDAFAASRNKISSLKLWIFGDGEEFEELKRRVRSLKLNKSVKFLGRLTPVKVKNIMDKAALFVLPSNHEGWGLVCLEALARGTPVVMTDTGCADEIVIDGKTGYVVPIGDTKQLAKKIIFALANQKRSLVMAKAGRKLVEKDCDWENIRRHMLVMFNLTARLV